MTWLGLDIGGANLKAANADGWAHSSFFPLWREPQRLAVAIQELIKCAPDFDGLAVTMTGELCDCFRTKTEGVHHILAAVEAVSAGREAAVFLVDGRFVTVADAKELPRLAAASNWRALAEVACRYFGNDSGVLIDVGSTTTDIIPIVDGRVAAQGQTDSERLASGELIYSGVGRTPICALVDALPWRDATCPVAAEVFATTADAYVLLGDIPEDPSAGWTADGRPLTVECARQRLARQLCEDASEISPESFGRIAMAIWEVQERRLLAAIAMVKGAIDVPTQVAMVSGSGEFLARKLAALAFPDCRQIIELREHLGVEVSRSAPAYAVAVLADARFKVPEQIARQKST